MINPSDSVTAKTISAKPVEGILSGQARKRVLQRCAIALPVLVAGLAGPFGTQAQSLPGNVARGAAFSGQWCAACHAVGPQEESEHKPAPSFLAIARMPSTTGYALEAFLVTPHPKMPNYELSAGEINDVVAYILSLRR